MSDKEEKKNPFSGIGQYFKDVRGELKKVFYPTFETVRNNTMIVIVTILIFGVIIWVLDFGFVTLRRSFIESQAGQGYTPQEMPQTDADGNIQIDPDSLQESGIQIDPDALQDGSIQIDPDALQDDSVQIVPSDVTEGGNQ